MSTPERKEKLARTSSGCRAGRKRALPAVARLERPKPSEGLRKHSNADAHRRGLWPVGAARRHGATYAQGEDMACSWRTDESNVNEEQQRCRERIARGRSQMGRQGQCEKAQVSHSRAREINISATSCSRRSCRRPHNRRLVTSIPYRPSCKPSYQWAAISAPVRWRTALRQHNQRMLSLLRHDLQGCHTFSSELGLPSELPLVPRSAVPLGVSHVSSYGLAVMQLRGQTNVERR